MNEGTTSAYAVRNPSLELRWLPRSMLVQIPYYPAVVFREGVGGSHYAAGIWTPEMFFDCEGLDIDTVRGVLVIGSEQPASTLAHEVRHHWQWTNKLYAEKMTRWGFPSDCPSGSPYWGAITTFYSYAAHEHDALRFQMKYAPTDLGVEWWIHLEKQKRGFFG